MGDRIVIMKDGVVQQIGTPQEVYAHPANVFVAGFIGTPSMTFLSGVMAPADGTLVFDAGQIRIPLPAAWASALDRWTDRAVIAGIRPSDVHLVAQGDRAAIAATDAGGDGRGVVAARVDVVEPMGDLAYIFADVGGHTFTVRVDPLDIPQVGQVVPLRIDGGALRLFDAETQQAIDTGTLSPAGASAVRAASGAVTA